MGILRNRSEIESLAKSEMRKLKLNMEGLGKVVGIRETKNPSTKKGALIARANKFMDTLTVDGLYQLADFLRMDVDDLALNKQQIGVNISGDKNLVGDANFVNSDDIASVIARATKDDLEYWKGLINLKLQRES